MRKFKILPHPSELHMRIYGRTLEELFSNALEAMSGIQVKSDSHFKENKIKKLIWKARDLNALLVDFLSDLLAMSQANKEIYRIRKIKIDKHKMNLAAEIISYSVAGFDEDIKAVTYQYLNIRQVVKDKEKIWQTDMVFDI